MVKKPKPKPAQDKLSAQPGSHALAVKLTELMQRDTIGTVSMSLAVRIALEEAIARRMK